MFALIYFPIRQSRRDTVAVAEKYLERGNTKRAAQVLSAACAQFDARAAKRLGDLWRTGVAGNVDVDKALNAYDKAATFLQAARERRGENWFTGNLPLPRPKADTTEFHALVDGLIKGLDEMVGMGVIGADEVLACVRAERKADSGFEDIG